MKPLAVSGTDGLGQSPSQGTILGLALVAAVAWWVYRSA
jgi:hypothetical protein